MEPTVLFEDSDVMVLDKPSGLVVHPDGKIEEQTLVDWLLEHYSEMQGVGEPLQLADGTVIDRPGIVHRIDRETSGVLVVAKHQEAYEFLKRQFQSRQVEKTYFTFLHGVLKGEEGVIDFPIGKSRKDFRLRVAVAPHVPEGRQARGELREAITEYKMLRCGESMTYVEAKPKTGRTHQLRAHFKAINHPIVCDQLYAPKQGCASGFTRLALHASALKLRLPSGELLEIEAPLPEDFIEALKRL